MRIKSISIKLFLLLSAAIVVFFAFFIPYNHEQYQRILTENSRQIQIGQTSAAYSAAPRHSPGAADLIGHLRSNFLAISLAFLGLFLAIFLGIKFLILNRISRISRYFDAIAATDDYTNIKHIRIRSKNSAADEIDTLARNFNILADKISGYYLSLHNEAAARRQINKQLQLRIVTHRQTRDELRELHDKQEALIEKRTGELSATNVRLETEQRKLTEANRQLAAAKVILEERRETMLGEREQLNHLFSTVENAKREWEVTMDCISDIVLLTDREMAIKRCNAAVLAFTGKGYEEIIGKRWPDILGDSTLADKAFNDMATEYYHSSSKRWFYLNAHTLTLGNGSIGWVITLHDFTVQQRATKALEEKKREVEDAYAELKQTQGQLLQQEKMASIGQLAAGVAHEINNPVGFISSNLGSLAKYVERLNGFIKFQAGMIRDDADTRAVERQKERRQKLKLDFIQEDIAGLIDESLDGCERVKKIVRDLKGFSRVDEAEKQDADINECLETTLNIAWNELKYKAKIEKDYGELPTIECYPQQLNQVFMNLLINATHAIEKEGIIKIKTWHDKEFLYISVSDNGQGIPPENQKRIFEPFFTTKEVGKGTGLGLSIVYDIVTKNHKGDIGVESEQGRGTTFTVKLPIR